MDTLQDYITGVSKRLYNSHLSKSSIKHDRHDSMNHAILEP